MADSSNGNLPSEEKNAPGDGGRKRSRVAVPIESSPQQSSGNDEAMQGPATTPGKVAKASESVPPPTPHEAQQEGTHEYERDEHHMQQSSRTNAAVARTQSPTTPDKPEGATSESVQPLKRPVESSESVQQSCHDDSRETHRHQRKAPNNT